MLTFWQFLWIASATLRHLSVFVTVVDATYLLHFFTHTACMGWLAFLNQVFTFHPKNWKIIPWFISKGYERNIYFQNIFKFDKNSEIKFLYKKKYRKSLSFFHTSGNFLHTLAIVHKVTRGSFEGRLER